MFSKVKREFRRLVRKIKRKFRDPDAFLKDVSGVIHIGANTGQEREQYAALGLDVLWVEPIPEVYRELASNLQGYERQVAYQYLVTDKDGNKYQFNVASNFGASSSIFDMNEHKDIWPNVHYERTIELDSITLPSLLERESINISKYDALIMDTQGSELLVLKGAASILKHFRYIKTEVPDFESYAGCCQLEDVREFLGPCGFKEFSRDNFAIGPQDNNYYDIVYKRQLTS